MTITTEARALVDGVTDGPWRVETMRPNTLGMEWVSSDEMERIADCSDAVGFDGARNCYMLRVKSEQIEANAAFIARSRTLVPELTSALEDALAENARLREALEARERDLSLVLASLRNLEAATEEYLAEEEGVLIGEIEDEQKLRSIHRAALQGDKP